MKVVGIKAHTENDKGQVLLDLYIRWVHLSFIVLFVLSLPLFFLVSENLLTAAAATLEMLRSMSRSKGTSAKPEWTEYRCVCVCQLSSIMQLFAVSHVRGFSHFLALFRLQLHGVMRVILEPLIGDVPIVGAVTMFFIKRPVRLLALTSPRLAFLFSLGRYWFLHNRYPFSKNGTSLLPHPFPETRHQLDRAD